MLSDTRWALLEPLIEAVRPKGNMQPQNLRRTMAAILWRHNNGAERRAVPAELGLRWRAAISPHRLCRGVSQDGPFGSATTQKDRLYAFETSVRPQPSLRLWR